MALCLTAAAQAPGKGEIRLTSRAYRPMLTFQSQVNEVDLGVVVRSRSGKLVPGLQRQNFILLDNRHPQTITGFRALQPARAAAKGLAAPRSVVLLLDDLDTPSTQAGQLSQAAQAARHFVSSAPAGDAIALFTTSGLVTQAFTTDHAPLLAALASIGPHSRATMLGCPVIPPYEAYRIVNVPQSEALQLAISDATRPGCVCSHMTAARCATVINAYAENILNIAQDQSLDTLDVLHAALAALARRRGDRLLLFASAGFPSRDLQSALDQSINAALRDNVVVSALNIGGLAAPGLDPSDENPNVSAPALTAWRTSHTFEEKSAATAALAQLASGTDGSYVENTNDLQGAMRTLTQAPAIAYHLAFTPTGKPDGKLHHLQVRLTPPGSDHIQARAAYLSPPPHPQASLQQQLNAAALASDRKGQIPAQFHITQQSQPGALHLLRIQIQVDPRRLPFVNENGKRREQLSFVAVLNTPQGRYVIGEQGEMNLRLAKATWQRITRPASGGLQAALRLLAAPGQYRLRLLIQESVKGEMTALTAPITLR